MIELPNPATLKKIQYKILLNNILNDRTGNGIRSNIPKKYVWEDEVLYIIKSWTSRPIPATMDINGVHLPQLEIDLNKLNINYRIVNLYHWTSNTSNLEDYNSNDVFKILATIKRCIA